MLPQLNYKQTCPAESLAKVNFLPLSLSGSKDSPFGQISSLQIVLSLGAPGGTEGGGRDFNSLEQGSTNFGGAKPSPHLVLYHL